MNKRVLALVAGLAVVIIGATVAYTLTRQEVAPSAQATISDPTPSGSSGDSSADGPGTAATTGTYVEYSPTAIADAEGRTLLFFHAPWCAQCRALEADILRTGVPTGVTIIKVDYDSHQDLRQQYGVTLQTTIVEVDSAGTGLQTYVAYDDPRLQAVIDAML
jgi:thiol-disulfide isomerase/thioredoxin